MSKKKIKLLWYGDTPTKNTGFGVVSKNILKRLQATGKYEIDILGINYMGEPHSLPYRIFPAGINPQQDIYGRQKLLDMLRSKESDYDVLFTLQDTFVMAGSGFGEGIKKIRDGAIITSPEGKKILNKGKGFKWVYYFPIDATPDKEWIEKSVKFADVAIPYTEYSKRKASEIVDRKYDVVYHGYDEKDFHIISEEEKQKFRDENFKGYDLKDKFFIINVNRNQERKDLKSSLVAFKILQGIMPNAILYMHCDMVGDRGGNLLKVAKQLGIDSNLIYPNPAAYAAGFEFPVEYMNALYNIADINLSTTLGEGFGLSMVEAMACKTINVFPKNTAITEILQDERGILVECGNKPNHMVMNGPLDNNLLRPTVDIEDLFTKILWVYRNPEEVAKMIETAYKFAEENLKWDDLVKKFDQLIRETQ